MSEANTLYEHVKNDYHFKKLSELIERINVDGCYRVGMAFNRHHENGRMIMVMPISRINRITDDAHRICQTEAEFYEAMDQLDICQTIMGAFVQVVTEICNDTIVRNEQYLIKETSDNGGVIVTTYEDAERGHTFTIERSCVYPKLIFRHKGISVKILFNCASLNAGMTIRTERTTHTTSTRLESIATYLLKIKDLIDNGEFA